MALGRRARNVVARPLHTVEGNRYYGLTCVVCRERFAVLNDATKIEHRVAIVGDSHLQVNCPHCGEDRLYEMADLQASPK